MRNKLTYRQYQQRRLGNRTSEVAGVYYMLQRSLLSGTFAGFWRSWNPLFSYYLYYYSYQPLAKKLSRLPAVLLTFSLSGAVHDFFVSMYYCEFYYLYTFVFLGIGLVLILEEFSGLHFKKLPKALRPFIHLSIIAGVYLVVRNLYY